MSIPTSVVQRDIDDGECGRTDRCMEKLAITRALIAHLKLDNKPDDIRRLRVKVDGANIKFNYGGYRWKAPTPLAAKNAMIKFDREERARIKPHRYVVHAVRGSKIVPFTRERQDQINEARQRRIAEGRADKDYGKRTVHMRVVAMAGGYG
jgi:hypothetical protein